MFAFGVYDSVIGLQASRTCTYYYLTLNQSTAGPVDRPLPNAWALPGPWGGPGEPLSG
jgi:hypothetical protein